MASKQVAIVGMPRAMGHVLVVDDEGAARTALQALLNSSGYEVELADDGVAALERLIERPPDVVVTDLDIELLKAVHERNPELPTIVVAAATELRSGVEAMRLGAADYIAKPIDAEELVLAIGRSIEQCSTRREVKRLRELTEGADRSMRALLAHLPDALITASATGEISFFNAEARGILAIRSATAKGRHLSEFFPTLRLDKTAMDGDDFLALPELEVGSRVYAPAIRQMTIEGAPTLVVTLRDVTEKRRLENRRLDFYSMVAHDLRSPLGAITLRVARMKGALPAEFRRDLELVEVRIEELVSMINDFLDIARSEAVGLTLALQPVDLVSLVRSSLADFEHVASLNNLKVRFDDLPTSVEMLADPARIKQAITNLISNAVKFSPKGGQVRVEVVKREHDVEFAVSDAGQGIAQDKISELFKRYSRPGGEAAVGTGLGLMVVREIVAGHSGTCGVESTLGSGSRFWFRVPYAPVSAIHLHDSGAPPKAPEGPEPASARLLSPPLGEGPGVAIA